MTTSVRLRKLNQDYEERVYAGLMGQVIGAGLGRHHLGDARALPRTELGKIGYDLSMRGDFSATFANESLVTALTSLRVLEDFGYSSSFGSEDIARTWLNYAIENRTMLWWGGRGHSAQHSAYIHLKRGISAPASGSIGLMGSSVAEQSGAEASATVWGLVFPGDIERAMEMAGKAARVAYDGEAVFAAQAIAGMVSASFLPACTLDSVVFSAQFGLPKECAVARLIEDLREWQAAGETWQHTRERILERYGCGEFNDYHVVPQLAGAIMALLAGENELSKSLAIAASAGWGTASNLGILGCVLGVKNGLDGIDLCPAWRAAVNDAVFLPSADVGRCVSDLATEAHVVAGMGRELQRVSLPAPKKGARYHFELPGSTQGFVAEMSADSPGLAILRNMGGCSHAGKRGLAIVFSGVDGNRSARISAPVFPKRMKQPGLRPAYMSGSPTLYPGQTIRAYVEANSENKDQVGVRPFIRYFGDCDELLMLRGPEKLLLPDARLEFQWTLPHATDVSNPFGTRVIREIASKESHGFALHGHPIAEVGLKIFSEKPVTGVVYLDFLTWSGAPRVDLGPPEGTGTAWQHAWVNAATQCDFGKGASALRVSQTEGIGMLIQGSRSWKDYAALANITLRMARSAGIAICVQGLQRYYALMLCPENKLRLIKHYYGMTVLAETDFEWSFGQTVEMVLAKDGQRLTAKVNGSDVFSFDDTANPLDGGAFALVVEEGCVESAAVRIMPME